MSTVNGKEFQSTDEIPTHSSTIANPYAYHKAVYRDTTASDFDRKFSARWLLGNGVQFDNDKMIDPENLPR